jgi:hypothetical protein
MGVMQSVAVNEILPKCELLPVPVVVPPNLEGQVGVYPVCSCVTALIFSGTFVGLAKVTAGKTIPATAKRDIVLRFGNFGILTVDLLFIELQG